MPVRTAEDLIENFKNLPQDRPLLTEDLSVGCVPIKTATALFVRKASLGVFRSVVTEWKLKRDLPLE